MREPTPVDEWPLQPAALRLTLPTLAAPGSPLLVRATTKFSELLLGSMVNAAMSAGAPARDSDPAGSMSARPCHTEPIRTFTPSGKRGLPGILGEAKINATTDEWEQIAKVCT